MVVIDALSSHEVRSFPYLGNVPRLRWDGDPQKGIDLLQETLRHLHAMSLLEQSKQPGDYIFARPPELATVVGIDPQVTVLYPDPPVGVGEAKRLAKAKVPSSLLSSAWRLNSRSKANQSRSRCLKAPILHATVWILCTSKAACSISRVTCSSKGQPSPTGEIWARKAIRKDFSN